jgi:hypothetical protein
MRESKSKSKNHSGVAGKIFFFGAGNFLKISLFLELACVAAALNAFLQ